MSPPHDISRRNLLHLAFASVLLSTRARAADEGKPPLVAVQPLGRALSSESTELVVTALRHYYKVRLVVQEPVALPKKAFYPPRQRYRAEKLLDFLKEIAPADASRVMGITAVDISTTKGQYADFGILGLATIDGLVCVLSEFRCARKSRDGLHVRARLAKTAVHELGHTFGLLHCPHVGCLMRDGRGTVLTTDTEHTLCGTCRSALSSRGFLNDVIGEPPWPRDPASR
jgi:archaemetzincin